MGRATAHPSHQCISSEDVQGTEVYGSDGKNIGEIDHLIIDKLSGRVAYAVMSFGGSSGSVTATILFHGARFPTISRLAASAPALRSSS